METRTGGRKRRRLRGAFSSRTGRAIGLTSLTAPLLGMVVNDLKKPDSVIRALVKATTRRLLDYSKKKPEAIDISDKVSVAIEETSVDRSEDVNTA